MPHPRFAHVIPLLAVAMHVSVSYAAPPVEHHIVINAPWVVRGVVVAFTTGTTLPNKEGGAVEPVTPVDASEPLLGMIVFTGKVVDVSFDPTVSAKAMTTVAIDQLLSGEWRASTIVVGTAPDPAVWSEKVEKRLPLTIDQPRQGDEVAIACAAFDHTPPFPMGDCRMTEFYRKVTVSDGRTLVVWSGQHILAASSPVPGPPSDFDFTRMATRSEANEPCWARREDPREPSEACISRAVTWASFVDAYASLAQGRISRTPSSSLQENGAAR